ncbi:MAG: MFS transporter [Bacteroidia bacterium]|nr:MFS transporter [Bacteroidia bacterium]
MENRTNRQVLAAGFIGMVFFGVAFVVMGAVLPSLIARFSLNTAVASTLAGLLPFGILLGSVLFGPIIDRYGYKILMIAASIIAVIGLEMLAFCTKINEVRLSIFIIGLGGGLLNGLTNALVSDASSDHSRASNLSILGVFYALGAITIPLLFASLSKTFSYPPIVAGAGVLMSLSVIYYFFTDFPKAKFRQGFPVKKIVKMAKEPAILILSFVLFFQSGLEGISNTWIASYMELYRGFSSEISLYALSFVVVGLGAGRLLLSFLLRSISKISILTISMLLSAIGILLISLFDTSSTAIAGTLLMGFGFASTFPIILGEIGERYKEISGTAFSFALVIALTGNTLINLLVGVIDLKAFPVLVITCLLMITLLYAANHFKTTGERKKN